MNAKTLILVFTKTTWAGERDVISVLMLGPRVFRRLIDEGFLPCIRLNVEILSMKQMIESTRNFRDLHSIGSDRKKSVSAPLPKEVAEIPGKNLQCMVKSKRTKNFTFDQGRFNLTTAQSGNRTWITETKDTSITTLQSETLTEIEIAQDTDVRNGISSSE